MLQDIIKIWRKYDYVFIEGIKWTLILSVITIFFGTVLGTVIAFMKMSNNKVLRFIADVYNGVIRGTPILLQLYFFWLWLPKILPIRLTDRQAVTVGLIVNGASFISEVIRSGIQAVDIGQTEAAKSLGIRKSYTMRYIILPQAVKNILPALGNEFISMLKQTSLGSTFFIGEIMSSWRAVQTATYKPIPSLIIIGIIYLILTYLLTFLLGIFERKLKESD
ncbi:MAG: amino acid ABC transporter permease [Oscillospiraceae bacterium]|nr:amino acid ABC transporter permease [Oscillospiraceae bacterium]MDY4585821.1 amino acid ABC transporter permease [Oscillospiraceae bacterium]